MSVKSWLESYFTDRERFHALGLGLSAGEELEIKAQVASILGTVERRREGGKLMFRLEELRGERFAPFDPMASAAIDELRVLVARVIRAKGGWSHDRAFALAEREVRRTDAIKAYQVALFEAAVTVEQHDADDLTLRPLLSDEPLRAEDGDPIQPRLAAEAAYRLPYWTEDPAHLSLAPHILRTAKVMRDLREALVSDAAVRLLENMRDAGGHPLSEKAARALEQIRGRR